MTLADKQAEIVYNFRRCHMIGCLGNGQWSPIISVSPDGIQRAYLPMRHWLMCDQCKNSIGIEDLIDGPLANGQGAWERIQAAFNTAGKDIPQKEFTNLLWEPA